MSVTFGNILSVYYENIQNHITIFNGIQYVIKIDDNPNEKCY